MKIANSLSRKHLFTNLTAGVIGVLIITALLIYICRYFIINRAYGQTYNFKNFSSIQTPWWIQEEQIPIDSVPKVFTHWYDPSNAVAYSYQFLGEEYIIIYDRVTSSVVSRIPVYE